MICESSLWPSALAWGHRFTKAMNADFVQIAQDIAAGVGSAALVELVRRGNGILKNLFNVTEKLFVTLKRFWPIVLLGLRSKFVLLS